MQLDIADNPGQYINVQAFVTAQGRLVARAQNVTSIPVRNVRVEFRALINGQGVSRAAVLPLLNPGQTGDIDSGLNYPAGTAPTAGQVSVQVTGASID